MQRILIIDLIIVVCAVIFALQNAGPVTVSFLGWNFAVSLALLLLVTLCLGVAASLIASVPSNSKKRKQLREKDRTIKELQDNLVEYKKLLNPVEPVN